MQISSRRQLARRLLGAASPRPRSLPPVVPEPPTLGAQLLSRATFGANTDVRNDMARLGPDAWLEQQLAPDSIDDSGVESMVAAAVDPHARGAADLRMILRAIYSRRQLAWRMVHFLNNHFATYEARTSPISETKEDDAFRARCFDHFGRVLLASAASPAMIDYLDSASNVAGNPNENYARELLELHTVGIDGGYNETDVAEMARVFTGWNRTEVGGGGQPITDSFFRFVPGDHDSDPKSLSLGWSTPGYSGFDGRREGAEVLGFLAQLPATAKFFCGKLCRYFVSDAPPPALVARVQHAFQSSSGHLGTTVRALFLDPEFLEASAAQAKTHDGFEFVVNLARRFIKSGVDADELRGRISRLRSLPHQFPVPTGYPEVGGAWHGPGNLLPRWDFVDDLAHDRIDGTEIRWPLLFPSIPPSGSQWVRQLEAFLFERPLPGSTRWILARFMDERLAPLSGHPTWPEVLPHARDLLTLMLQLPEAQLH